MARLILSASALYTIMQSEFRRRSSGTCRTCKVPLPYFREPPDSVSANWALGTPTECPHQCQQIIAEVLVELWSKYDIKRNIDGS
jgi:hypothetical protein